MSRTCTQRSALVLGLCLGAISVLLMAAVDLLPVATKLHQQGESFLARSTDIPAEVVWGFAKIQSLRVLLVYALVLSFVSLCLGAQFVLWWRAGVQTVASLIGLGVGACMVVFVVGQMRLMSIHPYARDTWWWRRMWRLVQDVWTPAMATLCGLLLIAILLGAIAWRFGRKASLNSLWLGMLWPLLGPSSAATAENLKLPSRVLAHSAANSKTVPVIVIGLDSLRVDHVGALGGVGPTPHLDRFVDDAFVFSQARTPIARTHPSWVSMLTADDPDHHGVRYNRTDPSFTAKLPSTLPQHLGVRGYRTHFLTDDNMFSNLGAEHGFAKVEQPPPAYRNYPSKSLGPTWLLSLLPARWVGKMVPEFEANRALYTTYNADDFTQKVLDALDENLSQERPFLLAAHFCVAHYPGTQPGPFFREFQGSAPIAGYFKTSIAGLTNMQLKIAPAQHEHLRGLYRAGVANADRQFGQILKALKQTGVYERAVIVVWSDHGEAFSNGAGEPILPSHGLYVDNGDQDLRVVLAIRAPGLQKGRSDALVRTTDVAPTVLAALGLEPLPGHRDGQSLLPVVTGAAISPRDNYAETEIKWGLAQHPDERGYRFHLAQMYEYRQGYDDLVVRPRFHNDIVRAKHRALTRGDFKVVFVPTKDGLGAWKLQSATGHDLRDIQRDYPREFRDLKLALQERIKIDEAHLPPDVPLYDRDLRPLWQPWSQDKKKYGPPPSIARFPDDDAELR